MLDRREYTHLDWRLLAAVCTLCLVGLTMIWSTTWNPVTEQAGPQLARQLCALAFGQGPTIHAGDPSYRLKLTFQVLQCVGCLKVAIRTDNVE